ncbi:MAG: T9SS type A sorting domain-containing protein [Flavobacterium sp.]
MKNFFIVLFYSVFCNSLFAQNIQITNAQGWFESAYITWQPFENASLYNVYYSGNGVVNKKIDTELIRCYGAYYRADLLGLAAGTYTISVAPIINGVEGSLTNSSNVTVMPHDRNGFAHSNGRVPGAYNMDGTLKDNAVVVYITEENKNTISLFVIGASSNPCIGLQAIFDGFKRARDFRPLCVRVIGTITNPSNLQSGDAVIENGENPLSSITLEGVGNDAMIRGWGVRIKSATNVEIRNLGFMLTTSSERDNVGLQQDNSHVWVHHTDHFYGTPGSAADQAKGDGSLDVKRSTNVTISYNHFWDTGKSCLLGLGENTNVGFLATYHHNWFDHSDSRHPRVRYFTGHIYNNYFDGNSVYGIGSTLGSSLFVEGNYFRNTGRPMMISRQGTDILNGSTGTFSGENGGVIKAFNNFMVGQSSFLPYHPVTRPIEFDAYVASTRNEVVPSNVTAKQGGTSYNNFDTNPNMYINSLTVQSPEDARDTVILHAGRMFGGDLQWTFNNAVDDASNAVNVPLRNMLINYTPNVQCIQGQSSQTLSVPFNNVQTLPSGATLNSMVFVWGGTATDVFVSGLPANGVTFTKNMATKTVTITGNPTANANFSITTIGTSGLPVSGNGYVLVGLPSGNEIHNFTTHAFNSGFYQFVNSNMNGNLGNVTFEGLSLRARLTMEANTQIFYTTYFPSTLTLVCENGFSGSLRLNGVNYTASNGIIIIPNVPPGNHVITRNNSTSLYYIRTQYSVLSDDNFEVSNIKIYPNPVFDTLNIFVDAMVTINSVKVYNLAGQLVKYQDNINAINVSDLQQGIYMIEIETSNGREVKKFIKK